MTNNTSSKIARCRISLNQDFETLWRLPGFPITEAIGPFDPNFQSFDLELRISLPTGHIQSISGVPVSQLYSASEYQYRTGNSMSLGLSGRAKRFVDFSANLMRGRNWNCLIDIGGNDLEIAKQLTTEAKSTYVIDPVCSADDGKTIDGVQVVGAGIEDVDFAAIDGRPDVIVMRHTLEHISDPLKMFKVLEPAIDENALLLIEVPDFELALESLRLETIFHQHVNYFDRWSLNWLLNSVGFRIIAEEQYVRGPSGGSVLVAAIRDKTVRASSSGRPNLKEYIADLRNSIHHFENSTRAVGHVLSKIRGPLIGYGASLMLPAIAYHIGDEFSRIEMIIDDDEKKDGMTYRNLAVQVRSITSAVLPTDFSILITSFESERAIRKSALKLEPRRIVGLQVS